MKKNILSLVIVSFFYYSGAKEISALEKEIQGLKQQQSRLIAGDKKYRDIQKKINVLENDLDSLRSEYNKKIEKQKLQQDQVSQKSQDGKNLKHEQEKLTHHEIIKQKSEKEFEQEEKDALEKHQDRYNFEKRFSIWEANQRKNEELYLRFRELRNKRQLTESQKEELENLEEYWKNIDQSYFEQKYSNSTSSTNSTFSSKFNFGKKTAFYIVGALGLGSVLYSGYRWYKNKKQKKQERLARLKKRKNNSVSEKIQ